MNNETIFFQALNHLTINGCMIKESLELLAGQKKQKRLSLVAGKILSKLKNGESLATAILESGSIKDKNSILYIKQFEQTGNILSSLRLILEDGGRRKIFIDNFLQALIYPVCILAIMGTYIALLFFKGIPWMTESGLITDLSILQEMKEGTVAAALFVVCTTVISIVFTVWIFNIRQAKYSFWEILVTLTDSGFTFDQALSVCTCINNLPYRMSELTGIFDSRELDAYTQTLLLTATVTGDYQTTFKTILTYHKDALIKLYAFFGKMAEPAIMLLSGVTLVILSLKVLLPIVVQTGGFI